MDAAEKDSWVDYDEEALQKKKVLIYSKPFTKKRYLKVKRILDVMVSLISIVVLTPLFIVIPFIIRLDSKGSAIFKQQRMGKEGKPFSIYKFRTMRIDAPPELPTNCFQDSKKYITRVGRILRKTSLDELPQLFNIIKGEMSIIGPRPVVLTETSLIEARKMYGIYSIRPGLTGWAQICGRDELNIAQKVKLDCEYLEKMSFKKDLYIFFITILKVIKQQGIIEGEHN